VASLGDLTWLGFVFVVCLFVVVVVVVVVVVYARYLGMMSGGRWIRGCRYGC